MVMAHDASLLPRNVQDKVLSVVTVSGVRYSGVLASIDGDTVLLEDVTIYGTEDRQVPRPIAMVPEKYPVVALRAPQIATATLYEYVRAQQQQPQPPQQQQQQQRRHQPKQQQQQQPQKQDERPNAAQRHRGKGGHAHAAPAQQPISTAPAAPAQPEAPKVFSYADALRSSSEKKAGRG